MLPGHMKQDGRNARGERTRTAVAQALLELLGEGDLRPTSAQIAEKAGVSLRSVFQHFEDMDRLYATVADIQFARLSPLMSMAQGNGPLDDRIVSFVERRAELLETITPVRRAALLQEPFSEELARRLRLAHELAREEVERTFAPEIMGLPGAERSEMIFALDAASNWAAWDTSRRFNGLSFEQAKGVMERMVRALLAKPAVAGGS